MVLTDKAKDELRISLTKLEGVAEGLGIFHPRVGHYIQQRVDEMGRLLWEEKLPDLTHLSLKGRPEFAEADAEVMAHPERFELSDHGDFPVRKGRKTLKGKIEDRKVRENLE